ncbi:MAG TPA: type VI secretion system accessory protein TagJ [Bryobacteraceae bacterium]|nr:type VI secretion system accessory protein TagJ [Bryobacteraceae bacterium]
MNGQELFKAGKLNESVQALGAELRDNPADAKRRTFLFELLCFAGDYQRAEKQLDVLATDGRAAEMGALLYRAALHAERIRQGIFEKGDYPLTAPESDEPISGTLNGKPFEFFSDADPRLGLRLEVFAAGDYLWIPLHHVASVEVRAPTRLRDLLWATAIVRTGPAFKGKELGEVLLPVLAPLSWKHPDDQVRLGHATEWQDVGEGKVVPVGQKMFAVDEDEIPILDIRNLEFAAAQAAP